MKPSVEVESITTPNERNRSCGTSTGFFKRNPMNRQGYEDCTPNFL
ncbi:rCG55282 [Rattus norvegicus]|uniref:RCG55282 n=1 Tax=Rattus norvegicus TaxID=10116 RepID=A6J854_RAT|nr:rCG55282 [Rattus norvegicus]